MIFNTWKILKNIYTVNDDNDNLIGKLIIYKLDYDIICVSNNVS